MFQVETVSAKMLDYYVDRKDSLIVDIRSREEYEQSHVKGAVNIPYEELEKGSSLPKDKLLVLYCQRGGASLKAARCLGAEGFAVRSVAGGFLAYRGRNLVIFS